MTSGTVPPKTGSLKFFTSGIRRSLSAVWPVTNSTTPGTSSSAKRASTTRLLPFSKSTSPGVTSTWPGGGGAGKADGPSIPAVVSDQWMARNPARVANTATSAATMSARAPSRRGRETAPVQSRSRLCCMAWRSRRSCRKFGEPSSTTCTAVSSLPSRSAWRRSMRRAKARKSGGSHHQTRTTSSVATSVSAVHAGKAQAGRASPNARCAPQPRAAAVSQHRPSRRARERVRWRDNAGCKRAWRNVFMRRRRWKWRRPAGRCVRPARFREAAPRAPPPAASARASGGFRLRGRWPAPARPRARAPGGWKF